MLSIALIIPIYNGLSFTKKCLHSLYVTHEIDKLPEKLNVVIVDDGSSDGSSEWISQNYPKAELIKGDGNLWWSGGINLALDHALNFLNCDYIIWWNNDIIAGENYFKNLLKHLKFHDPKVIIGSKIYYAGNKDLIYSMGGVFHPKTGGKKLIGNLQKDSDLFNKKIECDWLPGMGTVTHRIVYDTIGLIDFINFPQYHGDSDFILRAKKKNFKIQVYPDLKIFNDTGQSGIRHNDSLFKLIQSLFSIKSNYNIKKDLLFYKKHAKSLKALTALLDKYFRYISGFIKWKFLALSGRKRNNVLK